MEGILNFHRQVVVNGTESYFKTTQIYFMKNSGPNRDVSYLALILFKLQVPLLYDIIGKAFHNGVKFIAHSAEDRFSAILLTN